MSRSEAPSEDHSAASEFGHALERMLRRIVRDELRGHDPSWVDQAFSDLGRKVHCAAVRRRIAEGKPGARIDGRRFLLSQEALAEEHGLRSQRSARPGIKKAAPAVAVAHVPAANDSEADDELDSALLEKLGVRQ